MKTLEKFANVIESGFVGRPDKPQLVKDQFESFWNVAYGTWKTPTEELPEGIQRCLGIDVDVTAANTRSSLPPSSPILSVTELTRPSTPDAEFIHETPLTPTTSASRNSGLLQFQKTISNQCFPKLPPTFSPTSPLRTRTPASTPTTPKRAGKRAWGIGSASASTAPKSKRRRLEEGEDKENASPRDSLLGKIPLMTERIAMKSPLAPISSSSTNRAVSGALKRQLEKESEDEVDDELAERPSPSKKGRLNSAIVGRRRSLSMCSDGSDDSVEERNVALSLIQSTPQHSKRRWIMESVEVPSFEEVLFSRRLRRSASLESLTPASPIKTPSTSGRRLIRKMRPSAKPTKMSCMFDPFVSSSSPISGLRLPNDTSGPRLVRTVSVPTMGHSSSSDDDPRYGQVTPHHLISPVPKKVFDVFDPPSDDSLPSSSPTKVVMARRSVRRVSID